MAQEDLIPFSERTEEEQKRIRTAGGIASGEARRRKKAMKEWAEIIGALPARVVCPDGKGLEDADLDADVVMQQYRAAHNGSTKAAQFIANLKGEMSQNINLEGGGLRLEVSKGIAQLMKEDADNAGVR